MTDVELKKAMNQTLSEKAVEDAIVAMNNIRDCSDLPIASQLIVSKQAREFMIEQGLAVVVNREGIPKLVLCHEE